MPEEWGCWRDDMAIPITRIPETEKITLAHLMQLYRYDLSEFNDDALDASGQFAKYPYFDDYWTDPKRPPFWINLDQQLVGFALVRELNVDQYAIAEFLILRKYRRLGIGKRDAFHLFQTFSAEWHVAQQAGNIPGQIFWRKVIAEYTHGHYQEGFSEHHPTGPKQSFRVNG